MKFKHYAEYFSLRFLSVLSLAIGANGRKIIAKFVGLLFFYLIPIRKKVVLKNLRTAFPEKSSSQLNDLAKKNYISLATSFLEISLLADISKDEIISYSEEIDLKAVKNLDSTPIFLTAHFGNWELGALLMGINLGKSITVLAKDQKNKLVAKKLQLMRERFGNKEVYLGVAVRELYKSLVNGNPIGVVADQRAPKKSGVNVKFFGQDTYVFSGFGSLALKLKSPIFLVLNTRQRNGKYFFLIEEIPSENLSSNKDEAIKELTQRYMTRLEMHIRQHPEQWFWMHNIWKY
jgi:KDO2-lipid IV(A) lauroyltransferase